ncbi:response regulator transcription factor [Solirubrobacter ginsenosidimutans]|uniref:Response regulator transcription factor n=1 Tax=Solirubrobacter ginsenosidimutans TaxID=490573 RepID=A0A9X3MQ84_9ACTN|nr:response regulator transcription factor [Solirubrobacter ginsenosidimutans]MDA0160866.1 response regulator transcription factor [Solirubrobacter ginsenosidimutans]
MRRLRLLVVDDHDVVRSGMQWLLRRAPWVESCACAGTTAEAVALARSLDHDVALVDVQLGEESGLRTCLELRGVAPGMRVALLSSRWDLVPTRLALDVGALGVVSKEARGRDLLAAVRTLADGLEVDVACPYPEPVRLLPWDREILELVAAGLTNAEIGVQVHLASGTIKQHTGELYAKLGVANRAAAVHAARRMGIISPAGGAEPVPLDGTPPASAVDVLVADRADATRTGLMVALQREPWVGQCRGTCDADDTLATARRTHPGVALVGAFGGDDGVEVSRALTAANPALRTMLVREDEPPAPDVIRRARASSVVLKRWDATRIAAAVRAVCADAVAARAWSAEDRVSPREREVLRVLVTGATNAEIAGRLGLSPHTVKQHTRSIYRKLGVRNRAAAAGRVEAGAYPIPVLSRINVPA